MAGNVGITDKELTEYLAIATAASAEGKKRGIDFFRIEENDEGEFGLTVYLTFKSAEAVLFTARRKARFWPNLNTLAAYIKSLDFPEAPITLKLHRGEHEQGNKVP